MSQDYNQVKGITTHAQYMSGILETVGKNHYFRYNGLSFKLTDQQLEEVKKEISEIKNPFSTIVYLMKESKTGRFESLDTVPTQTH